MAGSSNKAIIITLVLHFPFFFTCVSELLLHNRNELPEIVSRLIKSPVFLYNPVFSGDLNFIQNTVGYFLLTFTIKEVLLVSLFFFIFLLALWLYRRHEILRIKTGNRIEEKQGNSEVQHDSSYVISSVSSTAEKKFFYCLFCLLKNRYENFIVDDIHILGRKEWHKVSDSEKDSSSKNGSNIDTFCDFVCMVNRKCYFPVNVLIPETSHFDPSVKFNYSSEILQYNHYVASSFDDNMMKKADTSHLPSTSKVLQPHVSVFSSYDQSFLRKMGEIIELNYTDTRFSVEQLAFELNLSVSQVNRRLKSMTDYPAGQLLRVFRLQRAAGLIIAKAGAISEICFNTGFNSQPYFSRAFKKQFGYSPSAFRKIMTEKSMFMRQ